MRAWLMALGLVIAAATPAAADPPQTQSTQGHSALALAVIAGGYSPLVSAHQKRVLAKLLSGHGGAPHTGKIVVTSGPIDCRAGDVDITAFSCDLKFGAATRRLSGLAAHELYVTLQDAGVQEDGALGTMHMAV